MQLRLWVTILLSALTATATVSGARAEQSVAVEGVLVVTDCRGASYQQIGLRDVDQSLIEKAASCARMGAPVAILMGNPQDGQLYTLVSQSKALADHIATFARVQGREIAPRVIIPERLEILGVDGWIEIPTVTMM